jgi:hypothetical protein
MVEHAVPKLEYACELASTSSLIRLKTDSNDSSPTNGMAFVNPTSVKAVKQNSKVFFIVDGM